MEKAAKAHHSSSIHSSSPATPASGSWLSSITAPQRQHFFLTTEEARHKLDAFFDQQEVRGDASHAALPCNA